MPGARTRHNVPPLADGNPAGFADDVVEAALGEVQSVSDRDGEFAEGVNHRVDAPVRVGLEHGLGEDAAELAASVVVDALIEPGAEEGGREAV